jgi:tetratricopeptide (TPR) repeat protein
VILAGCRFKHEPYIQKLMEEQFMRSGNKAQIVLSIVFVLCLLFPLGCGSSVPKVELGKDYDFAVNRSVGVYVEPSGRDTLDQSLSAATNLYLISLGYNAVDLNKIVSDHADVFNAWRGFSARRDTLMNRSYFPAVGAVAILRPHWDSANVVTYYHQAVTAEGGLWQTFRGLTVLRLSSELNLFDVATKALILDATEIDTTRLYRRPKETEPSTGEYPWMLSARQVSRELNDIPVCAMEDTLSPKYRIPVIFHVDESYRKQFPDEWKMRLQRRLLFANDIFRREFDIGLELRGMEEWKSGFESSIDRTLNKLTDITRSNDKVIHIGVTLDQSLTWDWKQRTKLGVAHFLSPELAITAQPTLPSIANWNSLEEALTLVHELGHVFGAGHAYEQSSVMYSSAGWLGYSFDKFNRHIVDSMKQNFMADTHERRDKRYLKTLALYRANAALRNNVSILESAADAVRYIQYETNATLFKIPGGKRKDAPQVIAFDDLSLRNGIAGFMEFSQDSCEKALEYFSKSADLDPDFGEVHAYLYRTLRRLGRSKEAGDQLELAGKYHMAWLVED